VASSLPLNDISFADPWKSVLSVARQKIKQAVETPGSTLMVMFSPFMTVEEAYLLASYMKKVDPKARLVLGPVPKVGEDDCYPKGRDGSPPEPGKVKFTIRAEKCPNRMGVEAVLRHFQGEVMTLDRVPKLAKATAVYAVGGYPQEWVTPEVLAAVGSPSLLIVQDIFESPLSQKADIVLAAGSFAERDGTYVNHAGLAQSTNAAIRSPGEARADGRILFDLAERKGLFNAMTIRKEIGTAIPALKVLAVGDLGERGVRLSAQLKEAVTVS
jgi:NADH-quinone oxidoreductase subunit G